MKIGAFAVLLSQRPFEEALDYLQSIGIDTIEIGTGGYVGDAHCKPAELLANPDRLQAFRRAIEARGFRISALSCHGNALHPQQDIAGRHHQQFHDTVLLAERLGVDRVVTFSGCPGDQEGAKHPNWVTCPWPTDFTEIVRWQWEQKVIPYWREQAAFLRQHGVRVAIEMHPGFVVYSASTMLRLREAAGEEIGANFDPSHLFWQGADPMEVVRALGPAILHVHAKDTAIDPHNVRLDGVLDTTPYNDIPRRSWVFRTVGYGHGAEFWKALVSALRLVGYDYVLSIEHEDGLMSVHEGLTKAAALLKEAVIGEPATSMWWA
ncbi:MAG: xylose isomerase [Chloroflexi bacterium]|nr:xylose isomerase [Chloroflexota bacterium]